MQALCRRCHGELPGPSGSGGAAGRGSQDLEDLVLFCPHCSAPQLVLPDYLRAQPQPSPYETTGTLPPPQARAGTQPLKPNQIDWPQALSAAALVAVVAVFLLLGMPKTYFTLVGIFSAFGGSAIALSLYTRRRPTASVTAGIGLRIGLMTGLLMVVLLSIGLAVTSVVVRFGLHAMDGFDASLHGAVTLAEARTLAMMQAQQQPVEVQARISSLFTSPEVVAGYVLVSLAFSAGLLVLLAAAGGAFAGALRAPARRAG